MGGAVAQLCTLRLLRALQSRPPVEQLRCIVFGAPAIGNAALAAHVQREGWSAHFTSIALPEDPVPRLLLQVPPSQRGQPQRTQQASPTGAAAEAAASNQEWKLGEAGDQGDEDRHPSSSGSPGEDLSDSPAAEDASTSVAAAPVWRPAAAAAAAALARRPLLVAGGVARTAARGALAGASMLRPLAVLPAFSHIGQLFLLLPGGLVPAAGNLAAVQPGPDGGPAPWAQASQGQQWRQLHSMAHYRARAAAVCWRHVRQSQDAGQLDPGSSPDPPQGAEPAAGVALSRSLAPAVRVRRALACLPVVRGPGQRQVVQLTVEVHGGGLESCSGATLRLPGTPPLAASAVANPAKQRLLAELKAAPGSSSAGSGAGSGGSGWLRAAAERGWAGVHRWRQAAPPAAAAAHEPPGLVLRFPVPAAAILALQLQKQHWAPHADPAAELQLEERAARLLPHARLVLLNDFGRAAATVRLRTRVVWLLGLDGSLTADTRGWLEAAAATGLQPETRLAGRWRQRLPGMAAVAAAGSVLGGARPRAGSSKGASMPGDGEAVPQRDAAQHQQAEQEQLGSPADSPPGPAPPAVQRLVRLGEQLAAHLPGHPAPEQGPGLPAALLRGMLLLDASAVLAGGSTGSLEEQLEAATEALQLLAKQQLTAAAAATGSSKSSGGGGGGGRGGGGTSVAAASLGGVEPGIPRIEEVEDEYLAELRQLGLAARLRRQLAQAAQVAAAKRRALGRRHRRTVALLAAAPPPNAVLLVLHHRDLLSTQFGEGLDAGALGAVRRMAAACRACRPAAAAAAGSSCPVPLLLAVASRSELSAPYRFELAAATGLADAGTHGSSSGGSGSSRYGMVVPMPLLPQRQPGTGGAGSARAAGSGPPGSSVHQAGLLLASLLHYVGQPAEGPSARL
ncbi:hypothetical protein ABPG77_004527 [Micractinium sp. CCAP 211/92]